MSIYWDRITAFLGVLVLTFMAGTDFASALETVDFNHPAFASVGDQPTSIPIGHAEFCRVHSDDCATNYDFVAATTLDEGKWQELLQVNADFNNSIVPVTDQVLYQVSEFWTYPSGYGDCEDYVLAKRRQLIDLGWEPSTLMIAVVRQENGDGHAVLMVRTDRGDLVLDNQSALIKLWSDTPYHYLKRQSQFDPAQWVDIYDTRAGKIARR